MLRWMGWLMAVMMIGFVFGCGGGGGVRPSDTTPPSIENVQVTPNTLIEQGRQVTVQAKVKDEGSGVQSVTASVSYPDGTGKEEGMQRQSGTDVWTVTFTPQWDANKVGTDPTQWVVRIKVQARDRAGNQGESPESRIRAAAAGPPPPPF